MPDEPQKAKETTSHPLISSTWEWVSSSLPPLPSVTLPSVHPGHLFLLGSAPFCWHAYRGYRKPLERIVHDVLQKNTNGKRAAVPSVQDLKLAEEHVRRSVGSAVAVRALRVATSGSIGIFGLTLAVLFYSSGCTTTEQAVVATRRWAHASRRRLDTFFGIADRVDCDHPEYTMLQHMTEEQEIEHVSKMYFPDEDWESEVDSTSSDASQTAAR